ncbi:hypothetical protein BCR34DRAFT_593863 [Clohesyomyces aquaticus]|uniref:Uncharacterized protein n=1 Tax=Clohesyomyces aquaticus TaxID=1231657 RepID=A0A1Y1YEG0_9PLEO|nr:hypothetical protein BCR34DRAFT_593863 [Clohesyomyces aquaticus]
MRHLDREKSKTWGKAIRPIVIKRRYSSRKGSLSCLGPDEVRPQVHFIGSTQVCRAAFERSFLSSAHVVGCALLSLMLRLDKGAMVSFLDDRARCWEFKFILKDMPFLKELNEKWLE